MAYSVDSSWYLDDIVGIGVYIEEDKDFVIIYHKKRAMISRRPFSN